MIQQRTYLLRPGTVDTVAHHWVDHGVTAWAQRGCRVLAMWAGAETYEFVVFIEGRREVMEEAGPVLDEPFAQHIERVDTKQLESVTSERPGGLPLLVTADDALARPTPSKWQQVYVGLDGRSLIVEFTRGVPHALHHIEITENGNSVAITVWLGYRQEFLKGPIFVTPVGIREWSTARLEHPLADREIVDGAGQAAPLDPPPD